MNKRTKIVGVLLIILITGVIFTNVVYALSFKFKVTANKAEAKAGDEVIVSMEIEDIDMGELGINAIEGILDYDDNVLEVVTREDIQTQNNWSMTYNEEAGVHEGNFLVSNIIAGVKNNQKIGEIKFKIRADAKVGTVTEIKFKNITSNDGGNLVTDSEKKVVIKIVEGNNIGNSNNAGNNNNTSNTNTNSIGSTNNTNSSNSNSIKNISQNKIPDTGASSVIKVAIVLTLILGVTAYIKYKKTI